MYQNLMFLGVVLVSAMVVLRIYQSWQKEKALKPGAKTKSVLRQQKTGRRQRGHAMSAEPYHCVTLVGGCPALETYKGKRFLASSAPPLPVPDCTAERCDCHYTHHSDRRKPNEDRRTLGRMAEEQYTLTGNSERRGSHGRRKSDGNWATIDDWSSAV